MRRAAFVLHYFIIEPQARTLFFKTEKTAAYISLCQIRFGDHKNFMLQKPLPFNKSEAAHKIYRVTKCRPTGWRANSAISIKKYLRNRSVAVGDEAHDFHGIGDFAVYPDFEVDVAAVGVFNGHFAHNAYHGVAVYVHALGDEPLIGKSGYL